METDAPPRKRRNSRRLIFYISIALILTALWWVMIRMPGRSYRGALPPLNATQSALRDELKRDVQVIGGEIGERNVRRYAALVRCADFIEKSFADAGYQPRREGYDVEGKRCDNIDVELPGASADLVIIGGHYDSVNGAPGANDNGSGVAATLALARRFAGKRFARTIRFVGFVNEEPGHFQSELMGSWVYAKRCKERGERVAAMISLETIGYFSDAAGSQNYPVPLLDLIYPKSGNFIAFVGDRSSKGLVKQATASFRRHAQFPSEGAALPASIPGIGWSDHWAFWQHGYPGIMVTDTAPFRYPHYHESTDTPDKLNYESMARVVDGMEKVIADLADSR